MAGTAERRFAWGRRLACAALDLDVRGDRDGHEEADDGHDHDELDQRERRLTRRTRIGDRACVIRRPQIE